jgi:hypothetical protein
MRNGDHQVERRRGFLRGCREISRPFVPVEVWFAAVRRQAEGLRCEGGPKAGEAGALRKEKRQPDKGEGRTE